MTASRASLLRTAQDLGIALPNKPGLTSKALQALIRDHKALVASVRRAPPVDLDAGSPDADVRTFDLTPKELDAARKLVQHCLDGMGGKRPADLGNDEFTWVGLDALMR